MTSSTPEAATSARPSSAGGARKITGERVSSAEAGFNPTWQRHVAAYALAEPLLPPGRLLDLGCGVGHSYHLLGDRETVGVDIDPAALIGQDRETHSADMRALPFADGAFSSVLSVQSIEHVPDPLNVIDEAARVVAPDGIAVFVTPNRLTLGRPDEIIDPYHHIEFDATELAALCAHRFGSVEVLGLFGSRRYMDLFEEERRKLDRLLAKDPLRLRRMVPRRAKQALYDRLLRRTRAQTDPRAAAIVPEDFELRRTRLDNALDLMAVCKLPRVGTRAENCAWCGASLQQAERLPPRLLRCERCGALTTSPRPSAAELDRAYGDWYRPAGQRRFTFLGDAILGRSRARLARRVDDVAPPGRVLDVGAGEGSLLDALRGRGREAVGLERAGHRSDMRDEPIEAVEGNADWAAVIFWHSLEHLPDPASALRAAARLLVDGGVLFVAVPNVASLQARIFGSRWLHLDLPRHIVHLSADALITELSEVGFSIARVSQVRGGQIVIGWLDGLVGALPGDLRLYQALRRSGARSVTMSRGRRLAAVAAGVLLLPLAALLSMVEIAMRRGGTVYVEGRRERS